MATGGGSSSNETFQLESVVRGHHVYKTIWTPSVGQLLQASAEEHNTKDSCAVGLIHQGETVGHMPREISTTSWFFLRHGGNISCEITGRGRRSPIPGKGLEVPCKYTFSGKPAFIKKLVKLLTTV